LPAPARALTPRRLLDLCNRLATVEDVKELIENCNMADS
jgi:hypothetical protein